MSWEALTAIATLGTFIVLATSALAAIRQLRHRAASNQINASLSSLELGVRMFNNFEFLVSRARLWRARHEVGVFPPGTPYVEPQELWPEHRAWLSDTPAAPPNAQRP